MRVVAENNLTLYLVEVKTGKSPYDSQSYLVDVERDTITGPYPTQSMLNQGGWLEPLEYDENVQKVLTKTKKRKNL